MGELPQLGFTIGHDFRRSINIAQRDRGLVEGRGKRQLNTKGVVVTAIVGIVKLLNRLGLGQQAAKCSTVVGKIHRGGGRYATGQLWRADGDDWRCCIARAIVGEADFKQATAGFDHRAAAEVREALKKNNGTLADPGSVAYNFARKGVIRVPAAGITEDDILAAVLEAGAEDVENQGETFEILTDPSDMVLVREALQAAQIEYDSADSEFVANLDVPIDADTARKVFKLIDALEDSDDVQNVFSNFDLSAEVLAQLEQD